MIPKQLLGKASKNTRKELFEFIWKGHPYFGFSIALIHAKYKECKIFWLWLDIGVYRNFGGGSDPI